MYAAHSPVSYGVGYGLIICCWEVFRPYLARVFRKQAENIGMIRKRGLIGRRRLSEAPCAGFRD